MPQSAVKPIPEGYSSITPSLTVSDGEAAIDFYKRVFDAKQIGDIARAPDGKKIWHAELQIGDSRLMLNDALPEMGSHAPAAGGAVGFALWLYVPDCDAVFKRAVEAGAKAVQPPNDGFWGDRFGGFQDPFGHNWSVATHIEDVSPEEQQRRAAAFRGAA